jgi:PAS domain S-box-containing protein
LPIAIIVHDNGKILFANNSTIKILGLSKTEELEGKNIFDLIKKEYHEFHIKRIKQINSGDPNVSKLIKTKMIRSDGQIIEVASSAVKMMLGGRPCIFSIIKDITEEKNVQELKNRIDEKNRMLTEAAEYDKLKTEFFANLSHEFRTPINIIYSTTQLLELYLKDLSPSFNEEKLKKHILSVKNNCYRLLRMVNNLIDSTKIDAGYLELNMQNCNIISIVENITQYVSEYVSQKNIKLIFDTDTEEKIMACDPDKIERIMLNLLSNAIKFTKPGGSISVNIHDEKESIIISIKDSGVGIPEEKIPAIFERFVQVDKSLTRSFEGSGIGLSIVKSLVEMHKGSITVESELGKGTEFIISLPVTVVEGEVYNLDNEINSETKEIVNIEFSDIA